VNPKHLSVRMDRATGELWLTEEKHSQPVKRIKMITSDVILALAAEIVAVDDTRVAVRDLKFSDGAHIRLLVQDLTKGDPEEEHQALRAAAQNVLDNWEHGNLALAVRSMEKVMTQKENELDRRT
jgi:hypothetical protein